MKALCTKKSPPLTMKTMSKRASVSRRLLKRFLFFMVTMVSRERRLPTRPTPPRALTATPGPQKRKERASESKSTLTNELEI